MRKAVSITVTPEERLQLEKWSRGRSTPQRLVTRSRIVLLAANGASNLTLDIGGEKSLMKRS